jgi:hypothetical protein
MLIAEISGFMMFRLHHCDADDLFVGEEFEEPSNGAWIQAANELWTDMYVLYLVPSLSNITAG